MNILVPDSWLREYLKTEATPSQIKECLSLCGPTVERVKKLENDFLYEIEITSNRIDSASVYGLAHEAAAILPRFGIKARLKEIKIKRPSFETKKQNLFPLQVSDPGRLCHRLLAVAFDNISLEPSPSYIRERLEKSGVRSLNNIIDITNYIMLELGHPTHVFDYDRIKTGKLILRRAKKGEFLITLDNKKCFLENQDVIIDDGTGRIIDLPGIMGTANSVVTPNTKRIVFFIESNNPENIRRTSMRLALRTYAATLNEKHPHPELAKIAFLRGIELYQKLAGGKIVSEIIDIYPHPPKPKKLKISLEFINQRLGIKLSLKEIASILQSLKFEVHFTSDSDQILVSPPFFRQFDINIPEDIVEEVARIYGYHNLPSQLMEGKIPLTSYPKNFEFEEKIKQMLKFWGYTEVYHYSFLSEQTLKKGEINPNFCLKVANPLTAETSFMRPSLLPSMLETIAKNEHLKEKLSLFEIANVYLPQKNNLPRENLFLTLATHQGFFELKGTVESLLQEFGIEKFSLTQKENQFFHPQQFINIIYNKNIIVNLGKVHPKIAANFALKKELFLAEINLERLFNFVSPTKTYFPLPPFPPAIENFALVFPPKTSLGPVISAIYKISPLIKKIELVDRYENTITLKISYQDKTRNLTKADTQNVRTKILECLKTQFQIFLKKA